MALTSVRQAGFKQAAAPAVRRTRVVKVAAVQQKGVNIGSAVAAAAAAVLLVGTPVLASPVADLAGVIPTPKDVIDKTLDKLDSVDPPKGVELPKVAGEFRANPEKARELAADNSPAGSPEAEAKGAKSLFSKK